jgi:hypothetical protein
MRLAVKAFTLSTLSLFLFVGCASHGTWSESDRGAWADLEELIGRHEQSYYEEEWGKPVSRHEVKISDTKGKVKTAGEELLWLWKADGTGVSDQPGQGWEVFLSFNLTGEMQNWRVGTYRTLLTVSDVIRATRQADYNLKIITEDLGLSAQQHRIGGRTRQLELLKLSRTAYGISAATLDADAYMSAQYNRLATNAEIEELVELRLAEARARAEEQQRLAYSRRMNQYGLNMSGGLVGGGFLGPFTPNAYGPGMNADATGRPFIWQPDFGGPAMGPITPNAYGPGIGMDATGRPVQPACPPGSC